VVGHDDDVAAPGKLGGEEVPSPVIPGRKHSVGRLAVQEQHDGPARQAPFQHRRVGRGTFKRWVVDQHVAWRAVGRGQVVQAVENGPGDVRWPVNTA
jgi:hypothetical protein